MFEYFNFDAQFFGLQTLQLNKGGGLEKKPSIVEVWDPIKTLKILPSFTNFESNFWEIMVTKMFFDSLF